jgi:hypothetical protein
MGKAKRAKGRAKASEKAKNVTLRGIQLCGDGRCLEEVFDDELNKCQQCGGNFCGNHLYRVFSKVTRKQINLPRELPPGTIASPADDKFCNKCANKLQAKQ